MKRIFQTVGAFLIGPALCCLLAIGSLFFESLGLLGLFIMPGRFLSYQAMRFGILEGYHCNPAYTATSCALQVDALLNMRAFVVGFLLWLLVSAAVSGGAAYFLRQRA